MSTSAHFLIGTSLRDRFFSIHNCLSNLWHIQKNETKFLNQMEQKIFADGIKNIVQVEEYEETRSFTITILISWTNREDKF